MTVRLGVPRVLAGGHLATAAATGRGVPTTLAAGRIGLVVHRVERNRPGTHGRGPAGAQA